MSSNTSKRLGRKIVVDGITYHWKVSGTEVIIRGPLGKLKTDAIQVTKVDWYDFKLGQQCGLEMGMVTPKHIASFIKERNSQ